MTTLMTLIRILHDYSVETDRGKQPLKDSSGSGKSSSCSRRESDESDQVPGDEHRSADSFIANSFVARKIVADILNNSVTLKIGTLPDARRIERCRGFLEEVFARCGVVDAACRVVFVACCDSFLL
jgi:hypothetical protein